MVVVVRLAPSPFTIPDDRFDYALPLFSATQPESRPTPEDLQLEAEAMQRSKQHCAECKWCVGYRWVPSHRRGVLQQLTTCTLSQREVLRYRSDPWCPLHRFEPEEKPAEGLSCCTI